MRSSSLPDNFKHLYDGVASLLESEVRLAKTELRYGVKDSSRQAKTLGLCALLVAPGSVAFLAFVIIALGNVLGKNYALSALIVSAVFLLPAALFAKHSFDKIKEDAQLRETRDSINQGKDIVSNAVTRVRRTP